ncbi:MAG TPA: hypothetical protein VNB06_09105, partial [Thermoanaerobaculia bacterium]|nr:hypothetical protein [Thermoanaerobaculia bacterium]
AALAGAAWRKLDVAGLAAAHAAWVVPVVLLPLRCLAAGQAQLWRGRGDVPRGHLGLSATLWSPLLVVSAGALAIVGWALDLAPGDVHFREVGKMVTAARSPWAVVEGAVLDTEPGWPHGLRYGFSASFLLDLETGDWARLGPATHFERRRRFPAATPALAADGGRVVFRSSDGDTFFVDLPRSRGRDASSRRPRELDLTPRALPPDFTDAYAWALSPDGQHLAAVLVRARGAAQPVGLGRYLGSLRVVSLPEGTPVFSGELPWQAMSDELSEQSLSTLSVNLRWVDDTRLELAGCLAPTNPQRPDREAVAVPIHAAFASLDLALPGFATELTRIFAEPGCARYQLSNDGRIAVYRQTWWEGDAALRSTNGDPPVSLERPDRRSLGTVVGPTWVAQLDAAKEPGVAYQSDIRLRWFDRTGEDRGEVAVAERAMAVFGGEVVPGQLLVLVTEPPAVASAARKARQRLLLLDPLAGTLTPMLTQLPEGVTLHPVASYMFSWVEMRNQPQWTPEPGSPATRLLATNDSSLVWLDAARGSLRTVQAGPGSRDRLVVDP